MARISKKTVDGLIASGIPSVIRDEDLTGFGARLNKDGSVARYKARLVARGCGQKAGVDYGELFSPVVRYETVRAVLSLAAAQQLKMKQFDIKTAFLHGKLDDDVYMSQPTGYQDGTAKVCKLKRSLYGLKQSPKCWNKRITDFMKSLGYEPTDADPCMFTKGRANDENYTVVLIYVDDGLAVSKSKHELEALVDQLSREFQVSHHGEPTEYLGMTLRRSENGDIWLGQPQNTRKLLKNFKMEEAHPVGTPSSNAEIDSPERVEVPYREAVGALLHLAITTRPDIAHSVGIVARSMSCPTKGDWLKVKRIMRYLKGTIAILASSSNQQTIRD